MVTEPAVRQAAGLLARLAQQDIRLWVEDDRLRCSAPAGALTEPVREQLRAGREALMALLGESADEAVPLARRAPDAPLMATLAQEALLPLARARRDAGIYNVPVALELASPLDLVALNEALNALQARHEALRTCFPAGSTVPLLRPVAARISAEDDWTPEEGGAADGASRAAIARPFDLAHGPLWRYGIFRVSGERMVLLFVFHHLVFDGLSRDVFLSDLALQYGAILDGRAAPGDTPFQVTDFASWERRRAGVTRTEAAQAWWRGRFTAPGPSTALPRGAEGESAGSRHITVTAGSVAALRARATTARLPAAAIAMAASLLALHRTTGQVRLLAMTPLANRDHPEALGIIGYLNRVVPIAIALDPAATPAMLAAAVATELSEAGTHRFLPSEEIVGLPGLARCHLNRLLVSWQERRRGGVDFRGARELPLARPGADFGLALQFEGDGDRLACRIDHAEGVLGEAGEAAFAELLVSVLGDVVGDGWDRPIAEVVPPVCAPAALADVLAGHPAIAEAVADVDTETGVTTAWVVLDEERHASISDIEDWLRHRLGGLVPPIRLVSRAALPRDSAGAIDSVILRRMAERHDAPAAEPPQTDLERTIADLWRQVLWLDRPVGRNEEFRQLGGHSLLAVRMTAELEAKLGHPIGWRAVGGLTTVAALATAIEAGEGGEAPDPGGLDVEILSRLRAYTASWQGVRPFDGALIVGRNGRGRRTPLFWCLQSESELDQLARYVGDDQPIFGMRSGHAVMVKSRENIDRLALRYATEVMQAAPRGPLFLGGNCQAAVIAFHVARHARAAGREVALLILHEKVVPEPYDGRIALSFGRESTRNPYISSSDPHADLRPYYTGAFTIDLVSGAHGEFFREPNILDLAAMIRRRRDESVPFAASGEHRTMEGGGHRVEHLA